MESIRLKDHLGMDRREAADLMEVSQLTFHRILPKARRKIGCAIVCDKASDTNTRRDLRDGNDASEEVSVLFMPACIRGDAWHRNAPKLPELRKREHAQDRGRSRPCQSRKWQTWYTVRW